MKVLDQDEMPAEARAGETHTTTGRRVAGGLVAAACAGVVGLCLWLTPSEDGYGTHVQLGQPACSFLVRNHYPCPTCGVTTAMSATAHGRLGLAVRSQAGGVAVFAAVAAFGVAGVFQAAGGGRALERLGIRQWAWWVVGLGAALLAGWGVNLAAGYASGRWPLR